MLKHPLLQEAVNAFHAMWDNFPEPASLVHKSREVIAVNKEHCFKPGIFCSKTGKNGPHAGCLANKALAARKPVVVTHHDAASERELVTYWIPLDGYPDYFIHVSVRIAIDYDNRVVSLKPMTEEEKEALSYYQETNDYIYKRKCGNHCESCGT